MPFVWRSWAMRLRLRFQNEKTILTMRLINEEMKIDFLMGLGYLFSSEWCSVVSESTAFSFEQLGARCFSAPLYVYHLIRITPYITLHIHFPMPTILYPSSIFTILSTFITLHSTLKGQDLRWYGS